ncbi:hypothetical protein ABMA27_006318 [Loxostege sticticalis]|uniref:Gustatory receptor n=1 Tax=Loxostege sticticalis TaxID=481309 RepID=A0ABR3HIC6_LOXSC
MISNAAILDVYLYDTFSLQRKVQRLFGTCRICINNKQVFPPTVYQKAYSAMVAVVYVGVFISAIVFNSFGKYNVNSTAKREVIAASLVHLLAYMLNMIHVRFMNNDLNVDFVLSMRNLERCMRLDQNKSINTMLRKRNNVTTISLLIVTAIGMMFICSEGDSVQMVLTIVMVLSCELTIFLELNLIVSLMTHYTIRVCFVNSIIVNHLCRVSQYGAHYTRVYPNRYLRVLAAKTHDLTYSDVDIYFEEIVKNYLEFQSVCQFQMLLFWGKLVIISTIYLQLIVTGLQANLIQFFEWISMANFTVSYALLAIAICVRGEMFLRAVRETKRLCISVVSIYTDGPLRGKAGRILKILEASPPRFSVYDSWDVEGRALLKLFGVITTIIFTELQFLIL